jgi:hypothetical protein
MQQMFCTNSTNILSLILQIAQILNYTSVKICEICGKIYFGFSQMGIPILLNRLNPVPIDKNHSVNRANIRVHLCFKISKK